MSSSDQVNRESRKREQDREEDDPRKRERETMEMSNSPNLGPWEAIKTLYNRIRYGPQNGQ